MTQTSHDPDRTHRRVTDGGESLPVTTTPSLRPTAARLVLMLLVGVALVGYVLARPDRVGGQDTAATLARALGLLTAIGSVRFTVRMLLLARTTYVIDDQAIRRRYRLLYKRQKTEVPLSKVRSNELEQGRIQNLFGYGTIVVNQGLGTIRLDDVPRPERIRKIIAHLSDRAE